jgi:hypothetical protein
MCRPVLIVLVALGSLVLAAAPSAHAQTPTIVTDVTLPDGGPAFGAFTALDPLCPSGTFVDQNLGHGAIRRTLTCADGSGTFTILFLFKPPDAAPAPLGCELAGPFVAVGGTGAYAQLHGQGDFCFFSVGDGFSDTFTGRFRLR